MVDTAVVEKARVHNTQPYLHHEGTKSRCPKARAMRFDNPIVAIKQVPAVESEDGSIKANACTRTLVSFQSTGPTNICGVNNLPSVSLYVSKRVLGKRAATRMWGIEQNEARETYVVAEDDDDYNNRAYFPIRPLPEVVGRVGYNFTREYSAWSGKGWWTGEGWRRGTWGGGLLPRVGGDITTLARWFEVR